MNRRVKPPRRPQGSQDHPMDKYDAMAYAYTAARNPAELHSMNQMVEQMLEERRRAQKKAEEEFMNRGNWGSLPPGKYNVTPVASDPMMQGDTMSTTTTTPGDAAHATKIKDLTYAVENAAAMGHAWRQEVATGIRDHVDALEAALAAERARSESAERKVEMYEWVTYQRRRNPGVSDDDIMRLTYVPEWREDSETQR